MALHTIVEHDTTHIKPYIDNVKQALANEAETRAELGAHNLYDLKSLATASPSGGISFSVGDDGSLSITGGTTTSEFTSNYTYRSKGLVPNLKPNTKYIFSIGEGKNQANLNLQVFVQETQGGSITQLISKTNVSELEFTTPASLYDIVVRVEALSGKAITTTTLYPMIRLATDADTTHQPYAMTNRELTDALSGRYVLDSIEQLIVSYQTNDTFGLQLGRIYTAFTNYLSSLPADDIVFVSGLRVSGYNPLIYQGVTYFTKSSINIEELFLSIAWGASNLNLYRACIRASSPYFQEFTINGGTTQNTTHTDDARTSGQGMVLVLHKYKKI